MFAPRDPRCASARSGATFPGRSGSPPGSTRTPRAYDGAARARLRLRRGRHGHRARRSPATRSRACSGSSRDRALVNRLGFNNDGADAARRARLARAAAHGHRRRQHRQDQARRRGRRDRRLHARAPSGSRRSPTTSSSTSARRTRPACAICRRSSKLRPLLVAVRAACDRASPARRVPLLVKIAPDLADADVDAVADLALELGLDGIIATNTTIARDRARDRPRRGRRARRRRPVGRAAEGALARGAAPAARAHRRSARADRGRRHRDRRRRGARLRAGATLVQGYTGFIYGGPLWPRDVQRSLATIAHPELRDVR